MRWHELIEALPQGCQTFIGERGSTLSGGVPAYRDSAGNFERRLVMLLGEAASALASTNERDPQNAPGALSERRANVMV